MGSGMRSGFDEVQKLPAKVAYALEQNSNGEYGEDPAQPFLPPILPQIQTNLQVHPFRPRPQETLPSVSGLHITTSIAPPTRYEAPRRTSSSPNHTQRFSPYERPSSSQRTSPAQRAKFPYKNTNSSPEGTFQSPMRIRQEAFPPPPFQPLNIYQQPPQQPLVSPGAQETRSNAVNPTMLISNLMNDIPTVPVTELYSIRVRQQPLDARMCGNGLADRRHIDPPPVVQLYLNDATMNLADINKKLVVLHCFLFNAESDKEERLTENGNSKRLEGCTSQSPFIGPDEFNNEGAFFLFPDLSCRTAGRYRLQFRLSVTNLDSPQGQVQPFLAETVSDVFHVSLPTGPSKFPGMSESTPLTKALKAMGCNVKLRRGTAAAASRPQAIKGTVEYEESEEGGNKRSRSKTRQRKKSDKK